VATSLQLIPNVRTEPDRYWRGKWGESDDDEPGHEFRQESIADGHRGLSVRPDASASLPERVALAAAGEDRH